MRSPHTAFEHPIDDANRVVLHLDMDAFFALVEQRANPHLAGKPVLVSGPSTTHSVVCSASYEARPYGIKSGMSLWEARRLCPHALVVPADASKYLSTSLAIFKYLETYTPLVEPFSVDEAFLDVTGTWKGWGSVCHLAQAVKQWIRSRFDLTCSIGVAHNKLLAKLASEVRKPDGYFHLRPQAAAPFLESLPVAELCGIGPHLAEHLAGMGVRTCGDLGRFPEHLLYRRFGVIGPMLAYMGRGQDFSPVVPRELDLEAQSVSRSQTLAHSTQDELLLKKHLLWLTEEMTKALRDMHCEARRAVLIVRRPDLRSFSRHYTFPYFLQDTRSFYEAGCCLLKKFHVLDEPVRLIGIGASGLRREGRGEPPLFLEEQRRNVLISTLDHINDKYGDFTVKPGSLIFDRDPMIKKSLRQLSFLRRHRLDVHKGRAAFSPL